MSSLTSNLPDGTSVLRVQQSVNKLNSLGEWLGHESWLSYGAAYYHKNYTNLRNHIRENTNNWSNSMYCERLAYHYYQLACYNNENVYRKHKLDLESIKIYFEKCLQILDQVSTECENKEIGELKRDAKEYLKECNDICENLKVMMETHSDLNSEGYSQLGIALGSLQLIPMSTCSMTHKRLIQNIHILRLIDILENALSVPEFKNPLTTALYCEYLCQAYQWANQKGISEKYKQLVIEFKNSLNSPKLLEEVKDTKQIILDIIDKEISEYGSTLDQVKDYVEETFCMPLSSSDNAYVVDKYGECLLNIWLKETVNYLGELCKNKCNAIIQEIATSLDDVRSLNEIPPPLNQLDSHELLLTHRKLNLITDDMEATVLGQFKKQCWIQVLGYSNAAEQELVFLEALLDFLVSSYYFQSIIAELELESFCQHLKLNELIPRIMGLNRQTYGHKLTVLRQASKQMNIQDDLFLMEKFREAIKAYLKPLKIHKRNTDGRWIIEVKGKFLILSDILKSVEKLLSSNPEIEEVRFIIADIIHVDKDLDNDVWYGKNLFFFTKTLSIMGQVKWKLSGKDSTFSYSHNAGTSAEGLGQPGQDGYAGESGGNILILADEIKNSQKLIIISNGGQGSNGQDGGKGKDGKDGKGISLDDFKKKYPPVSKYRHVERAKNIRKSVESIKQDLQDMRIQWFEKEKETFCNDSVIDEIVKDANQTIKRHGQIITEYETDKCPFPGNIYIEGKLGEGNEITFSYDNGSINSNCQSFLVYYGGLGEAGASGGEYGWGGEAGYAGVITVKNRECAENIHNAQIIAQQGKAGANGKGGLNGKHGKNGWDMGYMDYSVSGWFNEKWPKVFGEDENSKLKLEFYENILKTRVRCRYRENCKDKSIYGEITASRIEHKNQKQFDQRQNSRQNNSRQHQAKAVKKKNISENCVMLNYSHLMGSEVENSLAHIKSNLDNLKQQALNSIDEQQEKQEKHSSKVNTKRHVAFQTKKNHSRREYTSASSEGVQNSADIENLVREIVKQPQELLKKNIEHVVFSHLQLQALLVACENLKLENSIDVTKLSSIETQLIDKYRLSTLHEISQKLPSPCSQTNRVELSLTEIANCLVEDKKNNIQVDLGEFYSYFFDNTKSEDMAKIMEKTFQSDNHALKHSIRTFAMELRQTKGLPVFAHVFEKEMSRSHNQDICNLWFECLDNHSLIEKLEGKENIKRDKFLKALYQRFNLELEKEKSWIDYIPKNDGAFSASYRQLLAHIFQINIRWYVASDAEDGSILLQHNHNPTAQQILHVLCRDHNNLIPLRIDGEYMELQKLRKSANAQYSHILKTLHKFVYRIEFDDYFKNKKFLHHPSETMEDSFAVDSNELENVEEIIKLFTVPPQEKLECKMRLQTITSQYVQSSGTMLLHYMLERFSNEGRQLSLQELYQIVNAVLNSFLNGKLELTIICWIIASQSQKCWMTGLIFLQLQNHFRESLKDKAQCWKTYLEQIQNRNILVLLGVKLEQCQSRDVISMKVIEEILQLLSDIGNVSIALAGLDLSEWSYALKENYWTQKIIELFKWGLINTASLSAAVYYLQNMENKFGTKVVRQLLQMLHDKQAHTENALLDILNQFHAGNWRLGQREVNLLSRNKLNIWIELMDKQFTANQQRDLPQLLEIIGDDANTSTNIKNNLCKNQKCIQGHFKFAAEFTESDIKEWVKKFKYDDESEEAPSIIVLNIKKWLKISKTHDETPELLAEMLAVVDRAIELTKRFRLRDTQKLTVMALLANNSSTLAQVSTGEGKSLIVVAVSIIKALLGEKVDIVTSSSVLAKRDSEINSQIFNMFDINVSHNCSEQLTKRKEAYSNAQVIYGDLANFQRDYLLDRFYGKNILGDRNFDTVIVDEVDSMLLDKGNNMLYLSHDLPCLDKLESVYIFIWQIIKRPIANYDDLVTALDPQTIRKAVLADMSGMLTKQDISKIGDRLSQQDINGVWHGMMDSHIIDKEGKMLKYAINDHELDIILSSEKLMQHKRALRYLIAECGQRQRCISIPNYLRSFVEQHLDAWIKSALIAFQMKDGDDYVVDIDRTGTTGDRNANIIILDRDTGTDQTSSQWDEALHQFLQLKHGCRVSLQSLKAVFISNVSFFKLYQHLYGLTGTLGSLRERDLLQNIHKVDFVTIPTYKSKQFKELNPIICTNKFEWIQRVCAEAKVVSTAEKRSVLIICESVNDVQDLYNALGGKSNRSVHAYTRDYEELELVQGNNQLEQGLIVIATNLAGRGTDITLTESLRKAGGLHVSLTYLPNNVRVEEQAFGRAARCGDAGSGQLIIVNHNGKEYSNSKMLDLKRQRDTEEFERIAGLKLHYDTRISLEESSFHKFSQQFKKLKSDLEKHEVPEAIRENLLQACLDKWAFWLDKHQKHLTESRKEFDKQLDILIHQLNCLENGAVDNSKWYDPDKMIWNLKYDSSIWMRWVKDNPVQMIKLANYLSQSNKHENSHETALELYNRVIGQEPNFSEAAHYYKAFALAKHIDWEDEPINENSLQEFCRELQYASRLFEQHAEYHMQAGAIIGMMKQKSTESIIQVEAFEEQQKSLSGLYYMFSNTVNDILGAHVTPQTFVKHPIKQWQAHDLHKCLVKKGILKGQQLNCNAAVEKDLEGICYDYGLLVGDVKMWVETHVGREFRDNELLELLKNSVNLPNREQFWRLLVQKNILLEDVKYLVVNKKGLKELDASFLDLLQQSKKEVNLAEHTLEASKQYLILYPELLEKQTGDDYVLKKTDFLKLITNEIEEKFKEMNIFSFNRKAQWSFNQTEWPTFDYLDSISLRDLTQKANIEETDATKILKYMIDQQVLKEDVQNSQIYRLNIRFDEIETRVKIPFCAVYQNALKSLFRTCFTYKLAFQKLSSQLKDHQTSVQLHLASRPHKELMCVLLDRGVISPLVVVLNEDKDATDKQVREICIKLNITNEDAIKSVLTTLERATSSLKSLKIPDIKLNPFTDSFRDGDYAHIEELHVFTLNGMELLLKFEEKKWTREMWGNFTIVLAMGVGQIIIGNIIELWSLGLMTHVGAAFISEGVGDIFFAVGVLRSGYFSWADYRQHKMYSLMSTALSVGVGAWWSRHARVSRFGHKLAAPDLQIVDGVTQQAQNVSQLVGFKLIKEVGLKEVGKEMAKGVALKTIQGVCFGLANVGVDVMIQKHFQGLCEGIGKEIFLSIQTDVDKHNFSKSLKMLYEKLGYENAKNVVNELTQSVLTEEGIMDKFLPIASRIVGGICNGLANAVAKRNFTETKLEIPIQTITSVVIWTERLNNIVDITKVTGKLLDDMEAKLQNTARCATKDENSQVSSKSFERFQLECEEQWKSIITEKAGSMVAQHIVTPLLQEGCKQILTHVGNKIQQKYESYKRKQNFAEYNLLKQQCQKDLLEHKQLTNEQQEVSSTSEHITEKFNEDLIKLMRKSRDPLLVATIMLNDIPMDFICVRACPIVLNEVFKKNGISEGPIAIDVETDGGLKQKCSSSYAENVNEVMVKLKLENCHYQLCDGNGNESNPNNSKNDCLYHALAERFPQLKDLLTPQQFRQEIAKCIVQNNEIQHHITQGWHKLPLRRGAYGGAKKPEKKPRIITGKRIKDEESSETTEVRTVSKHFIYRLFRYFRFGGIVQRAAEDTKLNREKVIESGASRYQDINSGMGMGIPAGHLVRAGEINPIIEKVFKEIFEEMKHFVAHTNNIPRYANEYHGIGGDIDNFQTFNQPLLNTINFDGNMTAEDVDTIHKLKDGFVAALNRRIMDPNSKLNNEQKLELVKARDHITKLPEFKLYQKGHDGYTGKHQNVYRY